MSKKWSNPGHQNLRQISKCPLSRMICQELKWASPGNTTHGCVRGSQRVLVLLLYSLHPSFYPDHFFSDELWRNILRIWIYSKSKKCFLSLCFIRLIVSVLLLLWNSLRIRYQIIQREDERPHCIWIVVKIIYFLFINTLGVLTISLNLRWSADISAIFRCFTQNGIFRLLNPSNV